MTSPDRSPTRIVPVILCGGAGSRLWPASRDEMPKPFLPLVAGRSTMALTLERVLDGELFAPPLVIANIGHRPLIEATAAEAGVEPDILLEPEGRDTGPAIAAAAEFVARQDPDALLLVLAADHLIRDGAGFRRTVRAATPDAVAGKIVLFGVRPTSPATGYGYIRPAEAGGAVAPVDAFVEKPDLARALRFVEAGYLWNSGNFMMRAGAALDEIEALAPDMRRAAAWALDAAHMEGRAMVLSGEAFAAAPRLSFDRAVMEKTGRAAVIAADFDWSDLGTWSSIWDSADKDEAGNVALGDAIVLGGSGNYVNAGGIRVGLLGLDDVVVVESGGALLVAPKSKADSVKEIVGKFSEARLSPDLLMRKPAA